MELENKEVVGNDLVGVLVACYKNFAVKFGTNLRCDSWLLGARRMSLYS